MKSALSQLCHSHQTSKLRSALCLRYGRPCSLPGVIGAGVAPEGRGPLVSINMGEPGYLIDLRQGAEHDAPLNERDQAVVAGAGQAGGVLLGSKALGGPTIGTSRGLSSGGRRTSGATKPEAKAWLVSLACDKAKEHHRRYASELRDRRSRHQRQRFWRSATNYAMRMCKIRPEAERFSSSTR
jgi:hypothetical protein